MNEITKFLSECGKKGGRSKSDKKIKSSLKNLELARKKRKEKINGTKSKTTRNKTK